MICTSGDNELVPSFEMGFIQHFGAISHPPYLTNLKRPTPLPILYDFGIMIR
jgi:hypothetical protein